MHQQSQRQRRRQYRAHQADDRQEQTGDEHCQDKTAAAAIDAVHGCPTVLVALGDGDRAAGPQRTAQRTVRGDHAHDQVTETGDQVGTGRVELDDFVLTDNVGFFGHDLSQHEVAERDDVGGKY